MLITSLLFQILTPSFAEQSFVENFLFRSEAAKSQKVVFAGKTEAPLKIDGRTDEAVWKASVLSARFGIGKVGVPRNGSVLMGAFDEANLYLAARCDVAEMIKLKSTVPATVDETAKVWNDDCVDFKLSADGGRTSSQFIATSVPSLYDAQNSKKAWNSGWQVAASRGDRHFILEMRIPLKSIGVPEWRPGMGLMFTFGRNDVTGERRELSTVFGEPYGAIDKGVTLGLGTAEEHQAFLATGMFTRESQISLYLDRDQYPSFQKMGTGRMRVSSLQTGEKTVGKVSLMLKLGSAKETVAARRISPVTAPVLDFDWVVQGRAPENYALKVELLTTEELSLRRPGNSLFGKCPFNAGEGFPWS